MTHGTVTFSKEGYKTGSNTKAVAMTNVQLYSEIQLRCHGWWREENLWTWAVDSCSDRVEGTLSFSYSLDLCFLQNADSL